MRVALLRGREHVELGALEALAQANAAIALSRGGAAKRYPHSDPNEDAAGFAWGAEGRFAAVADGHGGAEAAEIALLHLLAEPAAQWTEAPGRLDEAIWRRQALAALADTNDAVRRERAPREGRGARCTVSLAVSVPASGLLLHASIGDSHVFAVSDRGARELSPAGAEVAFLGDVHEPGGGIAEAARIGALPLAGLRCVVLVTDGLSERGIGVVSPQAAVTEAFRSAETARSAAPGLVVARSLAETALEAHRRNRSGDNVAVAVLWLSE